jgi:hypothetical protein
MLSEIETDSSKFCSTEGECVIATVLGVLDKGKRISLSPSVRLSRFNLVMDPKALDSLFYNSI